MNEYEKEMYAFLTEEENLKGLIIGKNQFDFVRENLIKTFWDKVAEIIGEHLKDDTRWEVKKDENIFSVYSKLYLVDNKLMPKKSEHPLLFFCWERLASDYPYYGLCTNVSLGDKRVKVIESVWEKRNPEISNFQKSAAWPLWDGDKSFDFKKDSTLLHIIPSKVDEKAKEYAALFIDFFENMKEVYDVVIEECGLNKEN